MRRFDVETRDGICPVYLHAPEGGRGAQLPCVLMYHDGPGMRPEMQAMAQRLADAGFAVLLPDLFYRAGPYEPIDPKVVFTDPPRLAAHRAQYMAAATGPAVMSDTEALLAFLQDRPEIAPGLIGVVGYCMGGRMALIAAATFPARIATAAAFHPGGLVTDQPDSPHLDAPAITAEVYVGGAADDMFFTAEQSATLARALADAGVTHTVETYPARHGWVPRDMASHDPAQAERHWQVLIALMKRALAQ